MEYGPYPVPTVDEIRVNHLVDTDIPFSARTEGRSVGDIYDGHWFGEPCRYLVVQLRTPSVGVIARIVESEEWR